MRNINNAFLLLFFFSFSHIMKAQEIKLELNPNDFNIGTSFQVPIKLKIIVQNNSSKRIKIVEPVKFLGESSINRPWDISIVDQDNFQYCFPNTSIVDNFKTIKIKKGRSIEFNVLLEISRLVKCEDSHPIDLSLLESLQITMYYTNYPTSNCNMSNFLIIKKISDN